MRAATLAPANALVSKESGVGRVAPLARRRAAAGGTAHAMISGTPEFPGSGGIAVVIPCYRVAAHVAGVVRSIPQWCSPIICVDDASPDDVAGALEALDDPRVVLLRHDRNRGVGAAVKTGWGAALDRGAEIVVKVDGDGQMDGARHRSAHRSAAKRARRLLQGKSIRASCRAPRDAARAADRERGALVRGEGRVRVLERARSHQRVRRHTRRDAPPPGPTASGRSLLLRNQSAGGVEHRTCAPGGRRAPGTIRRRPEFAGRAPLAGDLSRGVCSGR